MRLEDILTRQTSPIGNDKRAGCHIRSYAGLHTNLLALLYKATDAGEGLSQNHMIQCADGVMDLPQNIPIKATELALV